MKTFDPADDYEDSGDIMITNKINELNYFFGETQQINPNTNPAEILEELEEKYEEVFEEDDESRR